MSNDEITRVALKYINGRDDGASWYNLEIALSRKGYGGDCNTVTLLHELMSKGLIYICGGGRTEAPLYKISEFGKKFLRD
ncbi:hypothetical protein V8J88_24460 [Massilia sp. W12]|uniref:hypothetical protein n=1 Tax=Massilia sp. W12 TaxID=3126507 RepID=UPI0030D32A59